MCNVDRCLSTSVDFNTYNAVTFCNSVFSSIQKVDSIVLAVAMCMSQRNAVLTAFFIKMLLTLTFGQGLHCPKSLKPLFKLFFRFYVLTFKKFRNEILRVLV